MLIFISAFAADMSTAKQLGWVESSCGYRPEVSLDAASFEGHMDASKSLMWCSEALVSSIRPKPEPTVICSQPGTPSRVNDRCWPSRPSRPTER